MRLARLLPFLCFALALAFAVSAVNLTAPGVIVRTAESTPDADDDENRERELVAPARQAPHAERPAVRADRAAFPTARSSTLARTGRAAPTVQTDPLGSRLRC